MEVQLQKMIESSKRIVFLGGAGVSTESGIPDFRSPQGLYAALTEYGYLAEEIISAGFFKKNTSTFFDYYKKNLVHRDAEPNGAHRALVRLEKTGKLSGIITQNIDGLHQKAGSSDVIELHGSIHRNYCTECGKFFDLDYIMNEDNCKDKVPYCDECGSLIKPDVVLYDEELDAELLGRATDLIKKADMLIIGGTSMSVYPAAGLAEHFNGNKLVVINKSTTRYDSEADLVINGPIGRVLDQIQI